MNHINKLHKKCTKDMSKIFYKISQIAKGKNKPVYFKLA